MKKQRVLLVDDSFQFLEAASHIINKKNVELIGWATSGEEAVKKTAEENPDLILMDISMPGISGLSATKIIKKMPNPPRVIILTLYDNSEYRDEAKSAGADGFIPKLDFMKNIDTIFPSKRKTMH